MQDLSDGSLMIILIGLLGRFFVPMCHYSLKVTSTEEAIKNWNLALKLLARISVDTTKVSFEGLFSQESTIEISKVIFLVQQAGTTE